MSPKVQQACSSLCHSTIIMALLGHMTLLLANLLFARAEPLPPTYDGSMCSESSSCGGVVIKYPFYLADATEVTTDHTRNFSCGYTDLKIFCQNYGGVDAAFIQLSQFNYTVKDINYEANTILLAEADAFHGAIDSCPVVQHVVSFHPNWLRYKDSSNDNLTFFFGCYSGESLPDGFAAYKIDCPGFRSPLGDGSSLVLSSIEQLGQPLVAQDLKEHCSQVIVVPVLRDFLYGPNGPDLRKEYGSVLRQGFELEWHPIMTDPCHPCQESAGRCAYRADKLFLGCLCAAEKVGATNCSNSGASSIPPLSRHSKRSTKIYIVASVLCVLLLCLIILAFYLTHKYGYSLLSKNKEAPSIESFLQKNGNMHPKRYTYSEVKKMTKSFAVKLGQGGFGAVYRGSLPDGREVAVKMLKDTKGDGEEFMNEVSSICRTSHVNVVSLLGFCLQGPKRALLYEYMPNGSLERFAFNNNQLSSENTLTWEKLFEIAIGIARGLEYLHRGCNTRIVHFDIKPHNILLDQDFCPKISDFGLAKLCLNKESAISIVGARGTIGYIAPEVYSKQFGTVSSKSDVYSYGMMVLEMVGARDKKMNGNSESSSQYFPQWIYEHLDDYCISASEINGETTELVRKMIVVGLWCIQVTPTHRPTMTQVVEMLEGSTSILELPPKTLLMS